MTSLHNHPFIFNITEIIIFQLKAMNKACLSRPLRPSLLEWHMHFAERRNHGSSLMRMKIELRNVPADKQNIRALFFKLGFRHVHDLAAEGIDFS